MCPGYPGHWETQDDLESSDSEGESTRSRNEDIQPLVPLLKHDRYYFDDGNVTLSVEGTLYKIHWYLLRRYSSPISPMFSAPHDLPEDAPILLPVAANDFDIFLSILYPVDCGVFAATSVNEWTSILMLATQWNFQSIKTLAVNRLSSIASPVQKISLGYGFNIAEWVEDAYTTTSADGMRG